MRISFVLRLDHAELVEGRLVGDIEEVGSGRRQGVREPRDVVDFCCASAVASGDAVAMPREVPPLPVTAERE